ncbi:MAG: hypothetical protein JXJ04_19850 [Spirochaetales bacterium]|nr:hypothetical protein [Spirochaetales bacterium]
MNNDVSMDGTVDIVDALLIVQCSVGLNSCPQTAIADVNCDDSVNIIDALLIYQYYVGLLSGFC